MLTERQKIILELIVDDFLEVMTPISSNYLLNKYQFTVSSATIRNDMAALEQEGYLVKVHTSSGRMPSRKALKYYIEELKYEINQDPPQPIEFKRPVDNTKNFTQTLAISISERLGHLTQVSLTDEDERIKGMYITPLTDSAGIAIIVLDTGNIKQLPVKTGRGVTVEDLSKLSNFFNNLLMDKRLGDSRLILNENTVVPTEIRHLFDQLSAQINAAIEKPRRTVGHAGFSFLLKDMKDELDTLEHIYEDIESESLQQTVEQLSSNDVNIYFGDELDDSYKSISVIMTNFDYSGLSGNLMVIGPELMGYKHVINLLHSFKKGV